VTPADLLKSLPAVGTILDAVNAQGIRHVKLAAIIRDVIAETRQRINAGETPCTDSESICSEVVRRCIPASQAMTRVINATGVLLHTNLGRAVLSTSATDALVQAASTVDVEFDIATGKRGDRHTNVSALLQILTKAEAAAVVNNNAAATVLAVSVLGKGRDVILSRGEMVEIGGQFRMPDVIEASGCRLVGVGATNRTHARDYEDAISDQTGCILRCHRSNFDMVGFVSDVPSATLAEIAKTHNISFGEDLGAGALIDFRRFGIQGIRTVQESVSDGADLIWFSGDKLIGGPQAGILVGSKRYIDACKRHPLMRALRPDKLTLAALEATLLEYVQMSEGSIPFIAALELSIDDLNNRATCILEECQVGKGMAIDVVDTTCAIGAGAAPTVGVPSRAIRISGGGAQRIHDALLAGTVPVASQLKDGCLLIDMRSIQPADVADLKSALQEVFTARSAKISNP
jgi:L-seryl-tRNA(Ser) seleniumtransferase